MCGVRALPAALPDVRDHRAGHGVTKGSDRSHAGGAGRGSAGHARGVAVDGDLRAVPGLRDRLSQRCALRSPHGGHPGRAGRRGTHYAVVAASGVETAAPSSPAAGRLHAAGDRRPAETAPGPATGTTGTTAPAPGTPPRLGIRRVALHRLRHGRLAAPHPSRRPAGARSRRSGCDAHRRRNTLLRRAARPRRLGAPKPPTSPVASSPASPATTGPCSWTPPVAGRR